MADIHIDHVTVVDESNYGVEVFYYICDGKYFVIEKDDNGTFVHKFENLHKLRSYLHALEILKTTEQNQAENLEAFFIELDEIEIEV